MLERGTEKSKKKLREKGNHMERELCRVEEDSAIYDGTIPSSVILLHKIGVFNSFYLEFI